MAERTQSGVRLQKQFGDATYVIVQTSRRGGGKRGRVRGGARGGGGGGKAGVEKNDLQFLCKNQEGGCKGAGLLASQWQDASSPAGRVAGSGPPADPPSAPLAAPHTAAGEEQQLAAQPARPLQWTCQ